MLAGRDALKKGLRRLSGNGRSTGLWTDPWVPSDGPIILPRPDHIETGEEKVHDLLTEDRTNWDDEKLHARFDEVVDLGLDINVDATMNFWKRMWKLPITSKYKVFLWRACLGIIPTVEALDHRGMNINEQCGMCNIEPEGAFHALVDCPELQILWVMAKFDYSSRVYHANILEWLVVEATEWSDEQMATLAVAMYLVRERRNKKKFANEVIRVEELWPRVERVMDEFQVVTFMDGRNRMEPSKWVWEKPEYPYTKLNVDASVINEGGGAMGGVLRDETGACVGVYTHSVHFPNEPVLLEAIAIRRGLELAHKLGCKHLMVESDAKLASHSGYEYATQFSSLIGNIVPPWGISTLALREKTLTLLTLAVEEVLTAPLESFTGSSMLGSEGASWTSHKEAEAEAALISQPVVAMSDDGSLPTVAVLDSGNGMAIGFESLDVSDWHSFANQMGHSSLSLEMPIQELVLDEETTESLSSDLDCLKRKGRNIGPGPFEGADKTRGAEKEKHKEITNSNRSLAR
ncbi:uncharacterized protein G2W53_040560 [Senna tora]|uniref:RNase H type-1 domain-containing protein n=1 Tax=Senna tora TaxID=362788 RepID=A0A834SQ11_9FABA|nr:uncharacterized protein G2W53_040560 [Senna tora]